MSFPLIGATNIVNYCLMENREQQILAEITSLLDSVKSQMTLIEEKLAQLSQCVEPEVVEEEVIDISPIDIEIDEDTFEEQQETVEPEAVEPEMVEPQVTEEPEMVEPEMVEPQVTEEPQMQEDVEDVEEVTSVHEAAMSAAEGRKAVVDAMAARQAWRTDMPGTPVKDIRSAISLNDRLIFINYLFKEDPMAFQDTLTRINSASSLDEVIEILTGKHPEWDFESEVVYRFMMAVRRKIR